MTQLCFFMGLSFKKSFVTDLLLCVAHMPNELRLRRTSHPDDLRKQGRDGPPGRPISTQPLIGGRARNAKDGSRSPGCDVECVAPQQNHASISLASKYPKGDRHLHPSICGDYRFFLRYADSRPRIEMPERNAIFLPLESKKHSTGHVECFFTGKWLNVYSNPGVRFGRTPKDGNLRSRSLR
jgi:hypothetical protein